MLEVSCLGARVSQSLSILAWGVSVGGLRTLAYGVGVGVEGCFDVCMAFGMHVCVF